MKKIVLTIALFFVLLLGGCTLPEEWASILEDNVNKTFTIKWEDADGNVLEIDENVKFGTMPTYDGLIPTKDADEGCTYRFAGWSPEISEVTGDTTYVVQFEAVKKTFTIIWKNEDGEKLDINEDIEYGTFPTYYGFTPTKADDDLYEYRFVGWNPELSEVTQNVTYIAIFEAVEKTFTVTWLDDNGEILELDENVEYGSMPSYDGEEPIKKEDDNGQYRFTGWSPKLYNVKEDATYVATFELIKKTYTITWANENGAVLKVDENIEFGTMPSYSGTTPKKAGNDEFSYRFAGWSPIISEVTQDVTYLATFTEIKNTFSVTWKDENGTVLGVDKKVEYGAMPKYDAPNPTKAEDSMYTYRFAGWSPELSIVKKDAIYIATYEAVKKTFTVTWENYGNIILETDENVEYGTMPSYDGETPTREGNERYEYVFKGWNYELSEVTKSITYTAIYEIVKKTYTITWKNDDGTIITTEQIPYGTRLTYNGPTPTKPETEDYTYSFDGWEPEVYYVTKDQVLTANFVEHIRVYQPIITFEGINESDYRLVISFEEPAIIKYEETELIRTEIENSGKKNLITEIYFKDNVKKIRFFTTLGIKDSVIKIVFSEDVKVIEGRQLFYSYEKLDEVYFEKSIPQISYGAFTANGRSFNIYYNEDGEYSNVIQIDKNPVYKVGRVIPEFPNYTLHEYYYQMVLKNVDLLNELINEAKRNGTLEMFMYPYSNTIEDLLSIEAFTNSLVEGCDTDLEKVNVIYDFVSNNINYSFDGEYYFPIETLNTRIGVCFQYMSLMHDMLSTQGIVSFSIDCFSAFGTFSTALEAAGCSDEFSTPGDNNKRHIFLAVLVGNQLLYYDPTWHMNYGTDYERIANNYYVFGANFVSYKLDNVDLSYMFVNSEKTIPMWIDGDIYLIKGGKIASTDGMSAMYNNVIGYNNLIRKVNDGFYRDSFGVTGVSYRNCVASYNQALSITRYFRSDGCYYNLFSVMQFLNYIGKTSLIDSLFSEIGLIKISDYIISYYEPEEYYQIFAYLGNEEIVTVPSKIGEYDIKGIGEEAFLLNGNIKEVYISKGIKHVKSDAFARCENLEIIHFPDTVTRIGGKTEDGRILNSEVSINKYDLKFVAYDVDINNEYFKSIDGCLYTKDGTTLLSVPVTKKSINLSNVSIIGPSAFRFTQMEEIIIPSNIKTIQSCAFSYALGLKRVVMQCDAVSIGWGVFECCPQLESVILSGIDIIPYLAFYDCPQLKEVIIPEGVKKIERFSFDSCGVYKIVVPSTLESIENNAFNNVPCLKEIINHSSLEVAAFQVNDVRITSGESNIIIEGDYVFYVDDNAILIAYIGDDSVLYLPDNYDGNSYSIDDYLFAYEDYYESIEFSANLSRAVLIDFDSYIEHITEIHIPKSISTDFTNRFIKESVLIIYEE